MSPSGTQPLGQKSPDSLVPIRRTRNWLWRNGTSGGQGRRQGRAADEPNVSSSRSVPMVWRTPALGVDGVATCLPLSGARHESRVVRSRSRFFDARTGGRGGSRLPGAARPGPDLHGRRHRLRRRAPRAPHAAREPSPPVAVPGARHAGRRRGRIQGDAAARRPRTDDVGVIRGRVRVAPRHGTRSDDADCRRGRIQPVHVWQLLPESALSHDVQHGGADRDGPGRGPRVPPARRHADSRHHVPRGPAACHRRRSDRVLRHQRGAGRRRPRPRLA